MNARTTKREAMGKSPKYTYEVTDAYNCFGAGHNYCLTLYRDGKEYNEWMYDSILGIGSVLLRAKIRRIKSIYGAVRA
jgi:hypothetical protein